MRVVEMKYYFLILIYIGIGLVGGREAYALSAVVVEPISNNFDWEERYGNNLSKKSIHIRVAKDEYESFSVIAYSGSDVTNLLPKIVLENDAIGNYLNFDLKWVKRWYQAHGAGISHRAFEFKRPVLVPELLLNNDALIMVDHEEQQNYALLCSAAQSEIRDNQFVVSAEDIYQGCEESFYQALNELGEKETIRSVTSQQFYINKQTKVTAFFWLFFLRQT